jgi:hypothetical protein
MRRNRWRKGVAFNHRRLRFRALTAESQRQSKNLSRAPAFVGWELQMATTHAETLLAVLDYLNHLDRRFSALLRENRVRIIQSELQVADSFAQIADGEREAKERSRTFSRKSAMQKAR